MNRYIEFNQNTKVKFVHVTLQRHDDMDAYNHHTTYALETDDKDMVRAIAASHCHPKDQFCRRTGRVRSEGRLHSHKYRVAIEPTPFKVLRDQLIAGELTL